jgi:hypothetical protein
MLVIILFSMITLLTALRLIMYVLRRKRMRDLAKDIPGPKGLFMIGNLEYIRKMKDDVLATCNEAFEIYPNILKTWTGPELCVVINSPDLMQEVLTVTNFLQKPKFYEFSRIDLGLLSSKCKCVYRCLVSKVLNDWFWFQTLAGELIAN